MASGWGSGLANFAHRSWDQRDLQFLMLGWILQVLEVLRTPNIGGQRKWLCRTIMLPFGSHQAPLYRGSRQNRLKPHPILQDRQNRENREKSGNLACPEKTKSTDRSSRRPQVERGCPRGAVSPDDGVSVHLSLRRHGHSAGAHVLPPFLPHRRAGV